MGFLDSLLQFRRTPGPTGSNDSGDPSNPVKVPATPGTVGGSAEKDAVEKAQLKASMEKVERMIQAGRKAGLVQAADNLEYWRNGRGGKRTMPASAFQNEEFIKNWLLKRPMEKFREGAERRFRSGELRHGSRVQMQWIDSVYANSLTDLFFALGGFTIRSDVEVSATTLPAADGGGTIFRFESWRCVASDRYNWDVAKSTYIPGIGRVEDEEMRILERNGYGKEFDVESQAWIFDVPQFYREFAITGI